jgi:GT2 family glycosyltransferase
MTADGFGAAPDIAVVTPTFRRAERLRRLITALEGQDLEPDRFEVIVVDDASNDESVVLATERAEKSHIRIRVVCMERNGGPAPARNTGARLTEAPVVAFIDDDCVPDPGWVRAMRDAFARNPALGVVQGLTVRPDEPLGRWTMFREITWETPWFEGCNIAYRRDLLLATGGFDEEIRWYGEDTSAGWKVLEAGGERDFEPGARVTHDLEERGLGWRIRHGWLEANLVELAARHPGLRRAAFWRPWAFRRESVAFPLAVAGLLLARRWRVALLLVVPYLAVRRLPLREPAMAAGLIAIDAAQLGGHVAGSLRNGVVVL